MIRDEINHLDLSDRAVGQFGKLLAVMGTAVGAWFLYRTRSAVDPGVLVSIAAACSAWVVGRWSPSLLRPLFKAWMMLAVVLGFVMTRVILFVVFVLVVTPTGLVMRAIGKDPLQKHPDASMTSYWLERRHTEPPSERFRRLF